MCSNNYYGAFGTLHNFFTCLSAHWIVGVNSVRTLYWLEVQPHLPDRGQCTFMCTNMECVCACVCVLVCVCVRMCKITSSIYPH